MTKNPTIWVLADDRAGNVGQCLGVAEALSLPFERKDIAYGALGKLPNFLLGASLRGVTKESASTLTPPWPDLVIGAGRRTGPVARFIKKVSCGKAKLVQIMHPGASGADDFDLICTPVHDAKTLQSNEMGMVGAPHRVSDEKLHEAREQWQERFADLPQPLISLIVGGATKNKEFSNEMAAKLGQEINALAQKKGASVLVTTSRRTGDAADALMDEIKVPSFKFKWGDDGENPYFGFLSLADMLIVTGDSVSMCSEACATGKAVYIYAPDGMISDKHKRMVTSLVEGEYAYIYEGVLDQKPLEKLNASLDIAMRIKETLL